jgi:hypothetical protein
MTLLVANPATVEDGPGSISWPSFCRFWSKNYPKIVIQRPAEDLCDDCVVFANRHKYQKREAQEEEDDDEFFLPSQRRTLIMTL